MPLHDAEVLRVVGLFNQSSRRAQAIEQSILAGRNSGDQCAQTTRINVLVQNQTTQRIERFRRANHISHQAEAVRQLIEMGLRNNGQ